MRGYFEVGIYHPKTEMNIGTLWRTAYQLGAIGVFTIGRRYKKQSSDTLGAIRHIPLRHYRDWDQFAVNRPYSAQLIGIEMGGSNLAAFHHPAQAIYLLGAEDHGLPKNIINQCQSIISLKSIRLPSYNVAVAGSIVLYHRCCL